MPRRLANVTLDNLDDLPYRCRRCAFWELDPVGFTRAKDAGDPALEKEAWISSALLEWGSCGKIAYVDSVPAGFVLYAPPQYVPRSIAFPTSPVSADAVLLMTAHILDEFAGGGLGRQAVRMPRDEAAAEVEHVVAELPERHDHGAAADAATTDRDDPSAARQLVQACAELAERDVEGSRDVPVLPLVRLANVERDRLAALDQRAQLPRDPHRRRLGHPHLRLAHLPSPDPNPRRVAPSVDGRSAAAGPP